VKKSKSRGGGENRGCTISLIGCGASGAYAPGPDDEDEDGIAFRTQRYLN